MELIKGQIVYTTGIGIIRRQGICLDCLTTHTGVKQKLMEISIKGTHNNKKLE